MTWRWLRLNQFHGSCDAYAREKTLSFGRPSEEPRVIFSARDRKHFLRAASERGGVRGRRRVRASFVTTRDVSSGTSGRKQLDDLSTLAPSYGEWFYRHLLLRKRDRPERDTGQMVRTRKIENIFLSCINWRHGTFLRIHIYTIIHCHILSYNL